MMCKKFLKAIILFIAIYSGFAFADKLHLKNGEVYEGNITEGVDGKVWIEINSGMKLGFGKDEIEKIEKTGEISFPEQKKPFPTDREELKNSYDSPTIKTIDRSANALKFGETTSYVSDTGRYHIYQGIIYNNGEKTALFVEIKMFLYGRRKELVRIERTYTNPHNIPAKGKATYEFMIDVSIPYETYKMEAYWQY